MGKNLIIAIGNSGREDDGLGWAFLDHVDELLDSNFDREYRYQLQVEDADLISDYDHVLFVDADVRLYDKGFNIFDIKPIDVESYTSHELSAESVLHLCHSIYNKYPKCYALGISGASFNLNIGLTETGKNNLKNTIEHLEDILTIFK